MKSDGIVVLLTVSHSSRTTHQVYRKPGRSLCSPIRSKTCGPSEKRGFPAVAASSGTASTYGWVAPSTTLSTTPPPLEEALRRVLPRRCLQNPRARGRDPHRHSAAEDVPKGEN